PWRSCHRFLAWSHRGAHQGHLSGSFSDGDIRCHGDCAVAQAGWTFWTNSMSTVTDQPPHLLEDVDFPPERLHYWIMLAIGIVLCAAPFLIYPFLVIQVLLFALFALAFNLLLGFGGLLSFGHAAFFGWGSYIPAHSAK